MRMIKLPTQMSSLRTRRVFASVCPSRWLTWGRSLESCPLLPSRGRTSSSAAPSRPSHPPSLSPVNMSSSSTKQALQTFELLNSVQALDPADEILLYDADEQRRINREAPWKTECVPPSCSFARAPSYHLGLTDAFFPVPTTLPRCAWLFGRAMAGLELTPGGADTPRLPPLPGPDLGHRPHQDGTNAFLVFLSWCFSPLTHLVLSTGHPCSIRRHLRDHGPASRQDHQPSLRRHGHLRPARSRYRDSSQRRAGSGRVHDRSSRREPDGQSRGITLCLAARSPLADKRTSCPFQVDRPEHIVGCQCRLFSALSQIIRDVC